MATNKKLTRYTSAVTIVTADVMNSLYGGEYGYNDSVDGFHPLVFGHVHDGTHEDGHASKILLTNGAHVRGYLANANLGGTDGTTPAVRYSNIMCYSDATYGSPAARRAAAAAGGYDLEILAIPEYTEDPTTGEKCYYLDLSNSAGGINGSIQYNENGSFSGNNDLFYDYTNLRFGAGTNTPQRKVHIVDNAHPPLRVGGITAGFGTPLVIDGNGDIYSNASVGLQNLFESVELDFVGGGTQTGDFLITAGTTSDTLTLNAGANITLDGSAGTNTITISATGDQNLFESVDLNDAGGGTQTGDLTITADTTTDTLTLSAGANITLNGNASTDTITISADPETQFYSQWVGASNWVPRSGIVGSRDPGYGTLSGSRDITYKYVVDNTEDSSVFDLTTSFPANGNLTGGNTTSTVGSHPHALSAYEDNIPDFPSDIAVECRITAYFILDGGSPAANNDAIFKIKASYGSPFPAVDGASITATTDGFYLQDSDWNPTPSTTPSDLINNHTYSSVTQDGMIVVSDFSPLKIRIETANDGIVTFSLNVDSISGAYFGGLSGDDLHKTIRLLGTRILWTW